MIQYSSFQQIRQVLQGNNQHQLKAVSILQALEKSLLQFNLAGNKSKQQAAILASTVNLFTSKDKPDTTAAYLLLLNHLIQICNSSLVQNFYQPLKKKLQNLMGQKIECPFVFKHAVAVSTQLIRISQNHQLLDCLLLMLDQPRNQLARPLATTILQLCTQNPAFQKTLNGKVLQLSLQRGLHFFNNLKIFGQQIQQQVINTVALKALQRQENSLYCIKPILSFITNYQLAEKMFNILTQEHQYSTEFTVSFALQLFASISKADSLKATALASVWLAMLAESIKDSSNGPDIVKAFRQLQFNSSQDFNNQLLMLDISGPSPAQKCCFILKGMIEQCNLQSIKTVIQLTSHLIIKLPDQLQNRCLELLNSISVGEKIKISLKRNAFNAGMVRFGPSKILEHYPIELNGDPSQQNFEESNRIWLSDILLRMRQTGSIQDFNRFVYPIIQECDRRINEQEFQLKKQFYQNIRGRLWASLKSLSKVNQFKNLVNFVEFFALNIQTVVCSGLLDGFKEIGKYAGQNFKGRCSQIAKTIIVKLAERIQKTASQSLKITDCLQVWARLAQKQYLKNIFVKQSNNFLKGRKTVEEQMPIIEVLLAISPSISFQNQEIIANCQFTLFQLALKLTQHLSKIPNLQKKGLKFLLRLCQSTSNIYNEYMLASIQHFKSLAHTHLKLQIFMSIWRKQNFQTIKEDRVSEMLVFVKKYISFIIVGLRLNSVKTRDLASSFLQKISTKMLQLQAAQQFIQLLGIGLLGQNSMIKSDSIRAIAYVFKLWGSKVPDGVIDDMFEIVTHFLKSDSSQIFKQLIMFCRRIIPILSVIKKNQIVPKVVNAIFSASQTVRLQNRQPLRNLILKIVKKVGVQKMFELIPVQDHKFLKNSLKEQKRSKKKLKEKKDKWVSKDKKRYEHSQDESDQPIANQSNKMQIEQTQKSLWPASIFQQQSKKKDKVQKENDLLDFQGPQKRRRQQQSDGQSADNAQIKNMNRVVKKVKKDVVHQVKVDSKQFRSSAGSDRIINGKVLPVSFVQLNPKALNRRFSKKAKHIFEQIIGKGGLKGLKERIVDK